MAANKGHTAVVRTLLATGADIHAKAASGFCSLFVAAFKGHDQVVKILLEAGANVNATTSERSRAEAKADGEAKADWGGVSVLATAAGKGHVGPNVDWIKSNRLLNIC